MLARSSRHFHRRVGSYDVASTTCMLARRSGLLVDEFINFRKKIKKTAPAYKSTGCKKSSVPVEEKTPTRRASLQVDRLQNNSLQTEQKTNQAEPAYKPRCAIGGRPRPDGEPAYLSRRTKKEKIKKAKKKSCCRLAYLKRQQPPGAGFGTSPVFFEDYVFR